MADVPHNRSGNRADRGDLTDDITDAPVKRRRRIRLACQACRDRKIRCDGGTPVCDTCRRKNVNPEDCVYPAVEGNLSLSRNARNRTRPMHQTPSRAKTSIEDPSDAASVANVTKDSNGASAEKSVSRTPQSTSTQEHQNRNRARDEASRALNDPTLWAQEQYDISPGIEGSASSVNLAENVYDSLEHPPNHSVDVVRPLSIVYETRAPVNPVREVRIPDAGIGQFLADVSLPPKPLVDRFLEVYWNDIHPQSPLFHQQSFMKRYDRFWLEGLTSQHSYVGTSMDHGLSSGDKVFFATINLILALVQQRTPAETRKSAPSSEEVFYSRADRLLTPDLLELESIDLVQALVLKAAYLRESDMTYRSWIAAGTAIRSAQALGLYMDNSCASQVEKEERRRLWYSCVLMDRVQSMTYARPTMISDPTSLPYPTVIDDEYMSLHASEPDVAQPVGVPSRMAYFLATLKLSEIRQRFRQSLRPQVATEKASHIKNYSSIIEFDDDVAQWYEEVPSYLRNPVLETESRSGACFARQSNYLKCQYLHLRLILCRPLIVDFARNESSRPHTSLQQVMCQGCVETCIRAAQDLVDTIDPNIGTNLLPPGWYITSYYLYSAGTIMAIVLLTPALQELCKNVTLEELQHAWTQCLNCFAKYDRIGVRFARNCIIGLRRMFAEDHGVAPATKGRNLPNTSSESSGLARESFEPQVTSASILNTNYSTTDHRMGLDEASQDEMEPWWMNEDFHLLNTFETLTDQGSGAEFNDFWRFME